MRSRRPVAGVLAVAMIALYFLLPLDALGPRRAVLSWIVFGAGLGGVTLLLLRQIRAVLSGRAGRLPGRGLGLLMLLAVLVFAGAHYELAKVAGEYRGLGTRLDALYFTVVTVATLGYGDITPAGQLARAFTLVQIGYTFVFLTAAATALTRRWRDSLSG